jgi:hypothetical protein
MFPRLIEAAYYFPHEREHGRYTIQGVRERPSTQAEGEAPALPYMPERVSEDVAREKKKGSK